MRLDISDRRPVVIIQRLSLEPKMALFSPKQTQFWAKIGFELALFGFVFLLAKAVKNVISVFSIITYIIWADFEIGFVLHKKLLQNAELLYKNKNLLFKILIIEPGPQKSASLMSSVTRHMV